MNRPAFLLLLVLLLLACGCGSSRGGERQPGSPWATTAELHWLQEVGRWDAGLVAPVQRELARAYATAGTAPTAALHRAASRLARCGDRLAAAVGEPPTERLLPPYRLLEAACRRFRPVATRLRDSQRTTVVYGVLANDAARQLGVAERLEELAIRRSILGWRPTLAPGARGSHGNRRLDAVASKLAQKPVEVHCWAAPDWTRLRREFAAVDPTSRDVALAGWAYPDGDSVELAPYVCRSLERLLADPSHPTAVDADAVRVLAHESQHTAGVDDEAVAECYALQLVAETARRLGVAPAPARELAELDWSLYSSEPAGYRTSACVDGGALDLDTGSVRWP